MSSSIEVVQRIEDELETAKPLQVELGIFDVCEVRNDLDIGIKDLGSLFCDLEASGQYTIFVLVL